MFRHCIILAAGEGVRLFPLTISKSKAMVELEDEYLISKTLHQVVGQIDNVTVTVGYHPDSLIQYVFSEGVTTVINTIGQGVFWWLFNSIYKYLNEPLLVLPCDIITKINLDFLYNSYMSLGSPHCMLVPIHPIDQMEGDFLFGDNHIVSKVSRDQTSENFCSGIQVLNPHAIVKSMNPIDSHIEVWQNLIEIGELKFSGIYPEDWFSINDIDQYNFFLNKIHKSIHI